MMDMTGVEPQDMCAECHGLDGAGNRIKFPRLAGQKPKYIIKQLSDFRDGHRKNDGGQMQKMVTELDPKDVPRVADWFSTQESCPRTAAGDLRRGGRAGLPVLPQRTVTVSVRSPYDRRATAGRTARLLHRQGTEGFSRWTP